MRQRVMVVRAPGGEGTEGGVTTEGLFKTSGLWTPSIRDVTGTSALRGGVCATGLLLR